MDRGYNRNNNYNSKRTYILNQAVKSNIPLLPEGLAQEITEAIHTHQYKLLLQKTKSCTEVEISGLGRYYISIPVGKRLAKVITKKITKLQAQPPTEESARRLAIAQSDLILLNQKLEQQSEFQSIKRVLKANAKRDKELQANTNLHNNQGTDGEQDPTTGSD